MLKVVLKLFLRNIVSISAFTCAAIVLLAAFDRQVAANSSYAGNEAAIRIGEQGRIEHMTPGITHR